MSFHSILSDLLQLDKPGNLGEEKALGKHFSGLGWKDDHPHHPEFPPLPPSLQVWLHPIFCSFPSSHPPYPLTLLDNTDPEEPSQSVLGA